MHAEKAPSHKHLDVLGSVNMSLHTNDIVVKSREADNDKEPRRVGREGAPRSSLAAPPRPPDALLFRVSALRSFFLLLGSSEILRLSTHCKAIPVFQRKVGKLCHTPKPSNPRNTLQPPKWVANSSSEVISKCEPAQPTPQAFYCVL
jgi:hypothetical protein